MQNTECSFNKQQRKAVAKQKPRFTFHRIKNVSRTNGRNVKQPKAQKTNKKLPKGQTSSPTDGTNFEEVLTEQNAAA